MRKALVLLLSISIFLTSCSFPFSSKENKPSRVEVAKQTQIEIMNCFLNKDSEGIKKLMSPYVQNNYNLDREIEEAFAYIDGDIVSYAEPKFERAQPLLMNWDGKNMSITVVQKIL